MVSRFGPRVPGARKGGGRQGKGTGAAILLCLAKVADRPARLMRLQTTANGAVSLMVASVYPDGSAALASIVRGSAFCPSLAPAVASRKARRRASSKA